MPDQSTKPETEWVLVPRKLLDRIFPVGAGIFATEAQLVDRHEALQELRVLRASPPAPSSPTAFDDLLAVNEHTSNMWHEMHRVLLMALQLVHRGNHDGKSENCPTCHVVNEARKIGIVFDAETGEPLG